MSRRRRKWVLRLVCTCGRNIADVVSADAIEGSVHVQHRTDVEVYPAPGAPAPTYTWACRRCPTQWRRTHERLVAAYLGTPAGRVDVLRLGIDL